MPATFNTITLDGAGALIADRYPAGWYVGQTVRMTSGSASGQTSIITGYNSGTNTFTFDPPFVGDGSPGDTFNISRGRNTTSGFYFGSAAFWMNGSNETKAWIDAFVAYLQAHWPVGLDYPVLFAQTSEEWQDSGSNAWKFDITAASPYDELCAYSSCLADSRATNPAYTVDGSKTLAQWHAAYFKDRSGTPLVLESYQVYGQFSPEAADLRSYMEGLYQTGRNYWFNRAVYAPLKAMFPGLYCTMYQHGNGLGKPTADQDGFPVQPGYHSYHGTSWRETLAFDAYSRCINLYPTKQTKTGTIISGSTDTLFKTSTVGIADQANGTFNGLSAHLIGHGWGRPQNITSSVAGDLTLAAAIDVTPTAGDSFVISLAADSGLYTEWSGSDIGWDLWPAWKEAYPPSGVGDDEQFENVVISVTTARCRAHAKAFPDNPLTCWVYMDDPDQESFVYAEEGGPLDLYNGGGISPSGWARMFSAWMRLGMNHITAYLPHPEGDRLGLWADAVSGLMSTFTDEQAAITEAAQETDSMRTTRNARVHRCSRDW